MLQRLDLGSQFRNCAGGCRLVENFFLNRLDLVVRRLLQVFNIISIQRASRYDHWWLRRAAAL